MSNRLQPGAPCGLQGGGGGGRVLVVVMVVVVVITARGAVVVVVVAVGWIERHEQALDIWAAAKIARPGGIAIDGAGDFTPRLAFAVIKVVT